jgi:hypothetical protein
MSPILVCVGVHAPAQPARPYQSPNIRIRVPSPPEKTPPLPIRSFGLAIRAILMGKWSRCAGQATHSLPDQSPE